MQHRIMLALPPLVAAGWSWLQLIRSILHYGGRANLRRRMAAILLSMVIVSPAVGASLAVYIFFSPMAIVLTGLFCIAPASYCAGVARKVIRRDNHFLFPSVEDILQGFKGQWN